MGSNPAADSSGELTWQVEHLIGSDLDSRYRIEALLGKGGMGAVLRARHLFMDQPVAIKVLRPTLARDPTAARRFVREARGTLKVESDHAVKVLDFAITEHGILYMVLELLDGRTVGAEVYDDGPMPVRRALRVARQVCHALDAAHRVGLVHRDLKPDNIMLVRRGADPDFVKVLDFGLAKVMEGTGNQALSIAALTQGDIVFGTPDYMAPEQALGQELDARTDVYALGATLFEMLTGRPPFVGPPMQVLADHVRTPPPTLRSLIAGFADAEVEQLVARCLAKSPDARPASAAVLAAEIAAIEGRLAARSGRGQAAIETLDLPAVAVARAVTAPDAPPAAPVLTGPWAPAEEPPRRGRAPLVVLGAVLALAAIVVIVALTRARATPPAALAAVRLDASISPSMTPSASVDAGVAAVVDAGVVAVVDAGRDVTPTDHRPAPRAAAAAVRLAAHLDAAEAARRQGNRLRQLGEADQALELDRRSQRARWLLGDALVETDHVNGCRYLRSAVRIAAARSRADAAGCPD